MRVLRTVGIAVLLVTTFGGTFEAINQTQKIVASDAAATRGFGRAVAIDGTTAVVGAQYGLQGGAYVFTLQNGVWVEQQRLTVRDDPGGSLGQFGWSVAISGDRIIVGVPGLCAYIFVRENGAWTELQQLTKPTGSPGGFFGRSVAIDGTTAIVGASPGDLEPGLAYVFTQQGGLTGAWSLHQQLIPSASEPGDGFGYSVALDADRAIIGAPDYGPASEGTAYVFVRQGDDWVEQSKLAPSDPGPNSWFGWSVDVDGSRVIVGTEAAGAAYVFRLVLAFGGGPVWVQEARLTEPLSASADNVGFGFDVALSGTIAVVGAPDSAARRSPAHMFRLGSGGWWYAQELTATDEERDDRFGYSVDVSGDWAIVGSVYDSTSSGFMAGSAYLYNVGVHIPKMTVFLYPKPNPAQIGDPFSWIMDIRTAGDPLKTTLGVFAFTADGRSQLLNRITAAFPPDPVFPPDPIYPPDPIHPPDPIYPPDPVHEIVPVYSTPAFPRGLPPALGFLLVMFDTGTGEQIAVSADAIGVGRPVDPALSLLLKQRATAFARSLTLGTLNALRIGRLENLQNSQALPGLTRGQ